ncbi:protein of unknown function [Azospirillum lipoferum 4B]|uniref:Uncharacterized protein n=1 Tax=Azospirillum lipoferum (strain 4B) TaxID=862719 RepID=G7Z242_AZOL4|nr:protein of unknown function [Azospirillum lipoferum 4B]
MLATSGCFNEAQAFLLGKTPGLGADAQSSPDGASMRPKHFCSGRPVPVVDRRAFLRGFNEAQAFLLGKTPIVPVIVHMPTMLLQ